MLLIEHFPIKVQYNNPNIGVFVHECPTELKLNEPYSIVDINVCPFCYGEGWNMTVDGPLVCHCNDGKTV